MVNPGWRPRAVRRTLVAMNDTTATAPYPADREADVVLRDGSTVHVRPVRASDEAAIRAFLETISLESSPGRFGASARYTAM